MNLVTVTNKVQALNVELGVTVEDDLYTAFGTKSVRYTTLRPYRAKVVLTELADGTIAEWVELGLVPEVPSVYFYRNWAEYEAEVRNAS